MKKCIAFLSVLFFINGFAFAEVGRVTGLPIPRFVSLKSKLTNLRVGPSNQHSVKWVYHQKGYPVKVLAEFEHWRKISDIDGEDGWVHEAMLSGSRYIVILKNKLIGGFASKQPPKELLILRKPVSTSQPSARIQMGAICSLKQCKTDWCQVSCSGNKGWTLSENLWGITEIDKNLKFK